MRVKPNMYVRTIDGVIAKVVDNQDDEIVKTDDNTTHLRCHIIKASHNIIDLIEVGDYVNGERVIALKKDISERNIHMNSKGNSIFVDYDLANDWYYGIDDEDIKSIVTKEAFQNAEYRVVRENE